MTLEERARKLTFDRDLQREIVALLRTVRRETLEEAAKVASAWDLCRSVYDGNGNLCESTAGSRIAQAIRSLAVKEGEGV
jgi:hypothetical protein